MSTRLAALAALVWCVAAPGWAQGSGRFLTGPVGWTPTISLKDAGLDSNVFNEPVNPKEDRTAAVTAALDAQMTLAHFKVQGTAAADYAYYERLTTERTFGKRFNLRLEAPTSRVVPFATGAYQRARERQTPEVDVRSYSTTTTLGAGASIFVMARGAIQVAGRREQTTYDHGQIVRAVDIAERFNRDGDTAVVGFRFNVTDLTAIMADANVSRDRFRLKPDQNTASLAWNVAIEFAPDAVLRGRAGIGYHIMEPRGPSAQAFRGYTANVDLGYVLLERTRFNGRYLRDTSYSLEAPYYVLSTLGLEVAQLIGGPFELLLRGNRDRSDYPENAALAIAHRVDLIDTVAGGFAVRFSDTTRATVAYELARRQSPLERIRFDRRHVLTSFTYGF